VGIALYYDVGDWRPVAKELAVRIADSRPCLHDTTFVAGELKCPEEDEYWMMMLMIPWSVMSSFHRYRNRPIRDVVYHSQA